MKLKHLKLSILLIFICSTISLSQVTINQTEVDYTLKVEQDSIHRILIFWKDKDSSKYTSVKYSVSDFNKISVDKILENEISTINQLWKIAKDSIVFDLQSFNIEYPMLYSDVLNNYIQAFIDSKEWQEHVKQNGKKLNYKIIKSEMLRANVYKPLNDFLKTKGYQISGFETEKHGFVTKENLHFAGFSGDEIIPMPYMVWIKLDKL